MKIGIYLGYAPYFEKISLRQEGLGRYISFLLKGFVESGNQLIIACPKWVKPLLEELFEEQDIDTTQIELLMPASNPVIFDALRFFFNRSNIKKRKRKEFPKVFLSFADSIMDILISIRHIALFVLFMLLGAVLAFIALPICAVIALLYFGLRGILKACSVAKGKRVAIRLAKGLSERSPELKDLFFYVLQRWNVGNIQERVRKYSAEEVIKKINKLKYPPLVWYCPTAFWEEFNCINGTRVICVPDLVTTEFPSAFSQGDFTDVTEHVSKIIEEGTYFITYCEYLKDNLLVGKFFKDPGQIKVIRHAVTDMNELLNLSEYFQKFHFPMDITRYFAKKIVLPGILGHSVNMSSYLIGVDNVNSFSFKDVKYIFYPSQTRGNKNILNLVKAFEYVLRQKNLQLKLILTCNMNANSDLKKYIYDHRLQYDVLCFSNVSAQQLAALYMCAQIVVNPTLYEGGFPFTFSEAMSVGTPSIMGNIPQNLEELEEYNLDEYLFDPYDYRDIAKKIIKGLENRDRLIAREKEVYEVMKKRSWKHVCEEYMEAFHYFAQVNI